MSAPARHRPPKAFAPLHPDKAKASASPSLKGIVFDVDGTLCKPQSYMFTQMRQALGISKSTDILDHIHSLPDPAQSQAQASIRAIESEAMLLQEPQPGLVELMEYLEGRNVKMGLCTRNFDGPVMHLLSNFLPGKVFAPIVTRDFRPPKPDPAGIIHISKTWGLENGGEHLIMVGDSVDDVTAGYEAGAATVLLENDANQELKAHEHTGICIRRLDDLIPILDEGFRERG